MAINIFEGEIGWKKRIAIVLSFLWIALFVAIGATEKNGFAIFVAGMAPLAAIWGVAWIWSGYRRQKAAALPLVEVLAHDPVYGAAVDVLRMELDDPKGSFTRWSEDDKEPLRKEILEAVKETLALENQVEAVRNACGNLICQVSKFNVLVTTPEYSMFEGISGELRPFIPELAKVDNDLKEFFDLSLGASSTPMEMEEMLSAYVHIRNLWLSAYNAVRIGLGDFYEDRTKDWFRPFAISQQIFMEWTYRHSLGMPSNIPGGKEDGELWSPGMIKALMHSRWPEIVGTSHKHPRSVWEEEWESTFAEPSPYTGVAL